jgi:hypothetical protein
VATSWKRGIEFGRRRSGTAGLPNRPESPRTSIFDIKQKTDQYPGWHTPEHDEDSDEDSDTASSTAEDPTPPPRPASSTMSKIEILDSAKLFREENHDLLYMDTSIMKEVLKIHFWAPEEAIHAAVLLALGDKPECDVREFISCVYILRKGNRQRDSHHLTVPRSLLDSIDEALGLPSVFYVEDPFGKRHTIPCSAVVYHAVSIEIKEIMAQL